MLTSRAKVWVNGELVERPCRVFDVQNRPIYKRNSAGLPAKTEHKEIMFAIEYPRDFKMVRQWIRPDRLCKK